MTMTDAQVRRISAALWPDATEPGTLTQDFEHEPELYLDDEDPDHFEVVACSCDTELARVPLGGGWREVYEDHLRAVGQ